jgi:hypothetical protein
MSHGGHVESYVMSDVGMGMGVGGSAGSGAGAGYEYATAAGAAGIRAAGGGVAMQKAPSRKSTHTAGFGAGGASAGDYPAYEERTPYPAFAGPGPQPHEMYDQGGGVPGLRYRHEPGS